MLAGEHHSTQVDSYAMIERLDRDIRNFSISAGQGNAHVIMQNVATAVLTQTFVDRDL